MQRFVFTILTCWVLLTPLVLHAQQPNQTLTVTIGVPNDVLDDYRVFMHGRSPVSITQYSGPKSRRDVVEVILVQQALHMGGLGSAEIILKPLPNYARMISELKEGTISLNGTSIWKTDLKPQSHLFISNPVIANGQFEAGLYTSTRNDTAQKARTLRQVRQLTAVSSTDWTPDWNTLKHLDLRHLSNVKHWKTMVKMVSTDRADFLLAPFQRNSHMLLHVDNITLQPIYGIKLGLKGTRHFAVSARPSEGKIIFNALQRGLNALAKRGTITKAYADSGFFNSEVKNWHMLNKTP